MPARSDHYPHGSEENPIHLEIPRPPRTQDYLEVCLGQPAGAGSPWRVDVTGIDGVLVEFDGTPTVEVELGA